MTFNSIVDHLLSISGSIDLSNYVFQFYSRSSHYLKLKDVKEINVAFNSIVDHPEYNFDEYPNIKLYAFNSIVDHR